MHVFKFFNWMLGELSLLLETLFLTHKAVPVLDSIMSAPMGKKSGSTGKSCKGFCWTLMFPLPCLREVMFQWTLNPTVGVRKHLLGRLTRSTTFLVRVKILNSIATPTCLWEGKGKWECMWIIYNPPIVPVALGHKCRLPICMGVSGLSNIRHLKIRFQVGIHLFLT